MHCVWCGSRLHKIWRQYLSNVTSVPHKRICIAGRADLNSVSVQILGSIALLWSNYWKVSSVYTSRRRERRCDWSHTGFVNIVHSADILHTDTDTSTHGHKQTQTQLSKSHTDTHRYTQRLGHTHRHTKTHAHSPICAPLHTDCWKSICMLVTSITLDLFYFEALQRTGIVYLGSTCLKASLSFLIPRGQICNW